MSAEPSRSVPLKLLAGACLTALLWGCGGSPTGDGLGPGPNFDLLILIVGQVTDVSGEPLGLIPIRTTTFSRNGACGEVPLAPSTNASTDEDGKFRVTITLTGTMEFDACVTIEALPPPELSLQPSTHIRQAEAKFRDEPIDPIEVDIVLRQ